MPGLHLPERYMPMLQVGGQVITYLYGPPGHSDPFVGSTGADRFADNKDIPMIRFQKGRAEIDVISPADGPRCPRGQVPGGGDG